jgi:hypothetical protein
MATPPKIMLRSGGVAASDRDARAQIQDGLGFDDCHFMHTQIRNMFRSEICMTDIHFLPGLPAELILGALLNAPGNEIGSGKIASPESSAALVANAFGFFLTNPASLPALPLTLDCGWPAASIALEQIVRFPWRGGRHPCLDVLIGTSTALIGIESKRYEPFRSSVGTEEKKLSDAYWRPVWGDNMEGYQRCRDSVREGSSQFIRLDVAQLVKHAIALRTEVHDVDDDNEWKGKRPILFYLYAEPEFWPDGTPLSPYDRIQHRSEIEEFSDLVAGDEVLFRSCSYSELLATWSASRSEPISIHAKAVAKQFLP